MTRLRISCTPLTHEYLLHDEQAPTCAQCDAPIKVRCVLIECPLMLMFSNFWAALWAIFLDNIFSMCKVLAFL
jgi:hypothetical protein